jgi:hypothetical protein
MAACDVMCGRGVAGEEVVKQASTAGQGRAEQSRVGQGSYV